MRSSLADVWGKRDEVASYRDRLGKDFEAERAAAVRLWVEVERLTWVLQQETTAKEAVPQASVVSGKDVETLHAMVARLGEEVRRGEATKARAELEVASTLNIFHEVDDIFVGECLGPHWLCFVDLLSYHVLPSQLAFQIPSRRRSRL